MIDETLIADTAKVYSEKKIAVHITKKNEEWLNGNIVEVSGSFFMLDEFKKGIMPVFFTEIINIEPFTVEPQEVKRK